MTELITLTYSSIYPEIQRHLSVIGKRAANKAGENIFSAVTVSSAEKPIFDQYIQQAAQNAVAAIERFVSAYTEGTSSITFLVTNTRWNDPSTPSFVGAFAPSFRKYVIMYATAEYLSMCFPEYAKKYYEAAIAALTAIIRLVFFKAPPASNGPVTPSPAEQVITIGPTPIASQQYEWEIGRALFIDIFNTWHNIKLDCTTTETTSGGETVSIYYQLRKPGSDTAFTQTYALPKVFSELEMSSISNWLGEADEIIFQPTTASALSDTDRLSIIYTEGLSPTP